MNSILKEINNCNNVLLLTHENPDGDAIGSVVAMYHMLRNLGKKVDAVVPVVPPVYSFMNAINKLATSSDKSYDLAIVLDCATKERIGQNNGEFSRCKKSIVIDHHISNTNYGDINHIEAESSSCCQVLYYIFRKFKVKITKEMAEAFVVGVLTDSGGFANDNISKKTFTMIADLYDTGIDFHNIFYTVLSMKSKAQFTLMKKTIDRLELLDNGKIAFSYITKEDFVSSGARVGDHEGLVDIGRNIEGVEVSIFIREDDCYHLSLRSNGHISVNVIAAKFGGGGHVMAAGAKIMGNFEETKAKVIEETIKEINKQ